MRIGNVGKLLSLVLIVATAALAGCAPSQPAAPTAPPATATPVPPTATPVPPTAEPATQEEEEATPSSEPEAPAEPLPTPTFASQTPPTTIEEFQRISPEELLALIESGADIVVVDNQPEGGYEVGHVPTAVNLPWDMDLQDAGGLPKDKLLVLYCACSHEEDSGDVALQLVDKFGYENIMLLDGGWLRWFELEYPVEEG